MKSAKSLPALPIEKLMVIKRASVPIGVIYYGHSIRKKIPIYWETDIGEEIKELIADGNKNIEIHLS
jgi:hypothetical protein